MQTSAFVQRIALARNLSQNRQRPTNSAIVARFQEYDPTTGLIKVMDAAGGVYYQQSLFNQKLNVGDVIPASIQSGNIGFADGRNL